MRMGFAFSLLFAFGFVAAEGRGATAINFEGLPLGNNSYYNGSDGAGGFEASGALFSNSYSNDYQTWLGWSYSNKTDNTTPGYMNQYSAYPGSGSDGSRNYAVAFLGTNTYVPGGESEESDGRIDLPIGFEPTMVDIANTTYAARSMLSGDAFARRFGGASGKLPDWFRLTIIGRNEDYLPVASASFHLADYRGEGTADYIRGDWTQVDLGGFRGKGVRMLTFELDSTDKGEYGINTPAYFALDNLILASTTPTATAGDANGDGVVNRADAAMLAGNFGMTSGATWQQGDFNADGAVSMADLMLLHSHFSPTSGLSPAAVPEPSAAMLGAVGLAGLMVVRRRVVRVQRS